MYILMFMFKLIFAFILVCVLIIIPACILIYLYVFAFGGISIWVFSMYKIKIIIPFFVCTHTCIFFYMYMSVDYHAYIYTRVYVCLFSKRIAKCYQMLLSLINKLIFTIILGSAYVRRCAIHHYIYVLCMIIIMCIRPCVCICMNCCICCVFFICVYMRGARFKRLGLCTFMVAAPTCISLNTYGGLHVFVCVHSYVYMYMPMLV